MTTIQISPTNILILKSESGVVWIRDSEWNGYYLFGDFTFKDGMILCTNLPNNYDTDSRGRLKITGVDEV